GNQDDHDAIPDVFAGDPSVGDGEDQDNDGTADDGVSHGTMVAGIAAAATNNGEGIAGAAWGCKIMAVRVINPEGNAYTSDLFAGIIYAADSGADIINLSIDSYEIDGGGLFTLEFAIDYAHDTKGCVVVAAAGNNNTHPIVHPAQFSDTIAVGASDYSNPDGKASFSNWGTGDTNDRLVDVVAPGVNIYSTAVEPVSGNPTYSLGEGTSFSAPIVSGLAALVISRTGITNDPEAIRGYINDGASDLPGDPPNYPDCWDGNGMVKFAQTDSLPVKLSAFTATKTQDGEAILRWMAETEVNNVGWNIYRSVSKAGPFTNIDFVFGAGNSAFPNDYQYVDKNVLNGVTYFYYIEDVDIQGNKSKSAIVQTTKTAMKSETVRSETVRIAPAEFQLFQNYPNPFNPATWIPYQLVESAEVVIRIYNASGQLVRTLNLGNKRAGFYISREESVSWNGKSNQGDQVASGVYFYRIRAGSFTSMRRMVLMK
ncbi:S8 family serine peptidase, partial [bacterium]|nr:S8 family serine peptidase [bacterium]